MAARAAITRVKNQQLEPLGGGFQQIAQCLRVDGIGAAPVILQQQFALVAVAGQVDYIPALALLQRVFQRLAGGPVLQHAQFHRQA